MCLLGYDSTLGAYVLGFLIQVSQQKQEGGITPHPLLTRSVLIISTCHTSDPDHDLSL